MFELWLNDLIDLSRLSPWVDGVYELWVNAKPAPAEAYLRWMEIEPGEATSEVSYEIVLRREAA